jgi:hypothetical protein
MGASVSLREALPLRSILEALAPGNGPPTCVKHPEDRDRFAADHVVNEIRESIHGGAAHWRLGIAR